MTTLNLIIEVNPVTFLRASAAAALALTGWRDAPFGQREPRAPFCGMGVCQECRVTVNGRRVLACQTECQPDMVIERSQHANV
jgi:hypothetical protein